jgi:hypothetical protein
MEYAMSRIKSFITVAGSVALATACSDASAPVGKTVAFQVATAPVSAAPVRSTALMGQTITRGGDQIDIQSVQLVLRRLELEPANATTPCDASTQTGECEELELGPMVVDLPLTPGTSQEFKVPVAVGEYGKIQFEIHSPSGSDDAAWLALNPSWSGISVKVTGSYTPSGGVATPFEYTSNLDVEQEYSFATPLVVTDASGANVTLFVDLSGWFADPAGPGLLDPATANIGQPNEGQVKSAIEASLNAFEDENHDGKDDHGAV